MAISYNRQVRFNGVLDKLISRLHKLTAKVDKIDKQYTQYRPQMCQRRKRGKQDKIMTKITTGLEKGSKSGYRQMTFRDRNRSRARDE